MSDESPLAEDNQTPRRWLDKHEAIRHLIHTSIRLILKREDPFAIHLLINSADKMLIDLAKKKGQELRVDWELYIKDEYHKAFFDKHRFTYNYFKHAKNDFADELPIPDIMTLNIMTLFICVANYSSLFKEHTDHMTLFQAFVMNLSPAIIKINAPTGHDLLKNVASTQTMTPNEFFEAFDKKTHILPKFHEEVSKDLEDVIDFYNLSFSQLRMGETKSRRIFSP